MNAYAAGGAAKAAVQSQIYSGSRVRGILADRKKWPKVVK